MPHSATRKAVLPDLERVVVASVAVTARVLAEVAPELTFVQWRVLVLVDDPAGIAVGALAAALGAKVAAMSRLVGRLRARGLVETQRSSPDGRIVLVRETMQGRDVRGRVVERRRQALRAALARADLPAGAAETLARLAAVLEAAG